MAITMSPLTSGTNNADQASYTTASITPSANRLVLVAVANAQGDGATPATPTLSGNGLTWVQVATIAYRDIGTNRYRLTLFRAMFASPSAGALTIDFGGTTQIGCAWSVAEFDGIDTGGTNGSAAVVQSATNSASSGTSLTVTLAAFGSTSNGTYGCFAHAVNELHTPGAGFTEIHDVLHGTPQQALMSEWRSDNDTSVDASWATSDYNGGIAIEIKAATAAATAPSGTRRNRLFLGLYTSPTSGVLLADLSRVARNLVFSTGEHGCLALSCVVPRTLLESFRLYNYSGLPHMEVNYNGLTLWAGRLEDRSVVGGGLRLGAFGYWRSLGDLPYSALWSTTSVAEFRQLDQVVATSDMSQRFELDNNNRLYVAARKGEAFANGNFGAWFYAIPHNSFRQIVAVSFDYEFTGSTDWEIRLDRRDETGAFIATQWSLTGNGSSQSGTRNETLTACDGIGFHLAAKAAITFAGDTGTTRIKITNLRIKTTSTSSVYADEIAKALVTFVNGINGSQLQSLTPFIESPSLDLRDEIYLDQYPADILTRLARLGDNQSPPRQWETGVWEDRLLYFRPRGSKGRAWYVDISELEVQRTLDMLRNSAYGVYQDATNRPQRTATSTNTNSVSRYGVTRRAAVPAQTTSVTQAEAHRDAYLTDHKDPIPRSRIFVRDLFDAGGARWPGFMARAGDTITVRNLSPALGADVDRIRTFRVMETQYDVDNRRLEVTPEFPLPALETLLARREEGF